MSTERINQITVNSVDEVTERYPSHFPPPVILEKTVDEIPKKILLELTPTRVRVKCLNETEKVESNKIISYSTLAKILSQELTQDTGFLHLAGDKYQGVRRIYSQGARNLLVLEAKAQNRTVLFKSKIAGSTLKEYQNIPYPYLAMFINIKEQAGAYTIENTRLYSMKGPLLREDHLLYDYPYSNVYAESTNNVCWGNVKPPIHSFLDASNLISHFLNTIANGDLYTIARAPYHIDKFEELLGKLEDERKEDPSKPYPYETLVNSKRYNTIIEGLKF